MRVARTLRTLANLLDPPPKRLRPPGPIRVDGPSPFEENEKAEQERRRVCLRLLDDDVIGYVVMIVQRTTLGTAHVDLDVMADDPFWPALAETAARVVLEGDRIFGPGVQAP